MEASQSRTLLKQARTAIKNALIDEARRTFDDALSAVTKEGQLSNADDVAIGIVFDTLGADNRDSVSQFFELLKKKVLLLPDVTLRENANDHAVKAYLEAMRKDSRLGDACEQFKKLIERRRKQFGAMDQTSQVLSDLMERTLENCWLGGDPLDDVNPAILAKVESRYRRRCYEQVERLVEEFENLCDEEDGDALVDCLQRINKALQADPAVLSEHKGLRQRLLNAIADVTDILSSPDVIVQLLSSWQPIFPGEKNELQSIVTLTLGRALSVVDKPAVVDYGELVLQHGQQVATVERWTAWMSFCEQYLVAGSLPEAGAALSQAVDACYQAHALPEEPGRCPWLTNDRRIRNSLLLLPTTPLANLFALALQQQAPADHWVYRAVQRVVDQWWHLKLKTETEALLQELLDAAADTVPSEETDEEAPRVQAFVDDLRARLVLIKLSASKWDEALAHYDRFAERYKYLRAAPQFVRRVAHKLIGRRPRGWHGESRDEAATRAALSSAVVSEHLEGFGDLYSAGGMAGMTAVCMATHFRVCFDDEWITVKALREQELPDSDLHLDSPLTAGPPSTEIDEWWQRWYKDLGRELLSAWAGTLPGQASCVIVVGRDAKLESADVRWYGPGAAANGELQNQDDKGADAAVAFEQRVTSAVKTLDGKPALAFPDQQAVMRVQVTAIFCCDARTIMRYSPVAQTAAAANE